MFPFERLTPAAKDVLLRAQRWAERSHHSYLGTEHLLIGLLDAEGVAARALVELGVDAGEVRVRIDAMLGSDTASQHIAPTSRVVRVIHLAADSAQQMGDEGVDTEHLLLGLVREPTGLAAQLLADMGASLDTVSAAVARIRGLPAPPRFAPPPESLRVATFAPGDPGPVVQILADAAAIARARSEPFSGEHVLLALARSDSGRAAAILAGHGLSAEAIEKLLDAG